MAETQVFFTPWLMILVGLFVFAFDGSRTSSRTEMLFGARLQFLERLRGRSSFDVWDVRVFGDLLRRLLA